MGPGLISNANNAVVLEVVGLGQLQLDLLADGGVDGATETTIGGQGDVENLGISAFLGFDLGILVKGLGAFAVGPEKKSKGLHISNLRVNPNLTCLSLPCSLEISFSPGVFGGGHHLHGGGDLLNVLDRLEPEGDDLEIGHATLLLVLYQHLAGGGTANNRKQKVSMTQIWDNSEERER